MGYRTALYNSHLDCGAKIVDFGGWDMPLHYGSQIEEHHVVRTGSGMFDVSHMTVIDITGSQRKAFLSFLLANDVDKLKVSGKALYSAMLNDDGKVLDDLIVYFLPEDKKYRLVVNCATREKDLAWMNRQAENFEVGVAELPEMAMVAVQGPEAISRVLQISDERVQAAIRSLNVFQGECLGEWMYCRTGYTGEDGLEIILPNDDVVAFWEGLKSVGVVPCGLGARDTLRLEAGMNLYGTDMDETVTPLESNMAWTVAWQPENRDFIGREALERQKAGGVPHKLVGVVLEEKGILRSHQKIGLADGSTGELTSGSFSPTLGCSIALARIPASASGQAVVEMRKKKLPVQLVRPPFVRKGEKVFVPVS
ncbi:MAG: glycine cleavage system protein T [Proteobacteria bacterium]|nr:MAG: glycine cleavage system protein T [Pseudomonadota bacterium]